VPSEGSVGAVAVAFLTGLFWRVHHDGDRKAVILAGVLDQALPIFGTNIGRVDNGQLAAGEPLFEYVVKRVECIVRSCLVILVVADEPAEEIRRKHLRREEMPARQRRLAGAGSANQRHQGQFGTLDGSHWAPCLSPEELGSEKTAICDGAPSRASTGPTGSKIT
jgi:hypothetical protein